MSPIRPILTALAALCACAAAAPAGGQQLCPLPGYAAPPAPAPPEIPPPPERKAAPAPEPPAGVREALSAGSAAGARGDDAEAERLMARAVQLLTEWSLRELKARHASGMASAAAGGPQPPSEVSEMIQIDRSLQALAQVESGGMERIAEVFATWAAARRKQLLAEGREAADRGGPAPPPQIPELIQISRELAAFGREDGGLEEVAELARRWAQVRHEEMRTEGMALAARGEPAPPPHVPHSIWMARQLQLLGDDELADRIAAAGGEVLDEWSRSRTERIRPEGLALAGRAEATVPAPALELLYLAGQVEGWPGRDAAGRGRRERAAAAEVLRAWIEARVRRLEAPGREAAAAAGPETPAQVDEIVRLARQADCLGPEVDPALLAAIQTARSIGEAHRDAFRLRMDCPVSDADRAAFGRITAKLESHGWGPYEDTAPKCAWSGTITVAMTRSADEERSGNTGVPFTSARELQEDVEVRIEVADGVGIATVRGSGLERKRHTNLATQCLPMKEETVQERQSRFSGGGTAPVTVDRVGSSDEYVIVFSMPAFQEVRELTERWTSHQCRLPDPPVPVEGGDAGSETVAYDAIADLPIQDTAVPLAAPVEGAPLGLELSGSREFPYSLLGGTMTITWKLTRD